jgi:Outer membrane protein beta-barrel domain
MKQCIVAVFVFFTVNCTAQKSYHNLFVGTNLTATGLSIETSDDLNFNGFKSPRTGFNVGYKFVLPLNKAISLSTGIEFKSINSEFKRQHYDNSISGTPRTVFENINLSRLLIPLQAYYNFLNKEKFTFYITFGSEFIVLNRINRTVDYYIPSTPGNFIQGTFTGKQTIKFGDKDKSIGFSIISGIGSEFEIKEKSFTVELSFRGDASKNKLLTLRNIESDSYFFSKFKSFQLTLGYSFNSFKKK